MNRPVGRSLTGDPCVGPSDLCDQVLAAPHTHTYGWRLRRFGLVVYAQCELSLSRPHLFSFLFFSSSDYTGDKATFSPKMNLKIIRAVHPFFGQWYSVWTVETLGSKSIKINTILDEMITHDRVVASRRTFLYLSASKTHILSKFFQIIFFHSVPSLVCQQVQK